MYFISWEYLLRKTAAVIVIVLGGRAGLLFFGTFLRNLSSFVEMTLSQITSKANIVWVFRGTRVPEVSDEIYKTGSDFLVYSRLRRISPHPRTKYSP